MAHGSRKTTYSAPLTHEEILAMAHVLARRYCGEAMDVALHFADEHQAIGDLTRAGVWIRVAACLRAGNTAPTLS